jgi:hypothetical protein
LILEVGYDELINEGTTFMRKYPTLLNYFEFGVSKCIKILLCKLSLELRFTINRTTMVILTSNIIESVVGIGLSSDVDPIGLLNDLQLSHLVHDTDGID